MRRGYQEQAAKGYMTFDELGTALSELEESRNSAERELQLVRNRLERVEQLERDKDALREDYFGIAPDALEALTPEERHDFYKIVRLQVIIYPNCDLEISWAGGEGLLFSASETVPECDVEQAEEAKAWLEKAVVEGMDAALNDVDKAPVPFEVESRVASS